MSPGLERGLRIVAFIVLWWVILIGISYLVAAILSVAGASNFGVGVLELLVFGSIAGVAAWLITDPRGKRARL